MIVYPSTPEQEAALALFILQHALVKPSADARHIGWVDNSNPDKPMLLGVVCFNTFIGSTCQLHVAMRGERTFADLEFPQTVFDIVFNKLGLKKIFGTVNSKNDKAMRLNTSLGYEEEHRMPGLHDDGGDIVLFSMTKDQCRFLRQAEPEIA